MSTSERRSSGSPLPSVLVAAAMAVGACAGCEQSSERAPPPPLRAAVEAAASPEPPPAAPASRTGADRYWPQWRGPLGTGVAPHADPPVDWSEAHNIRWRVPLPGKGHSTPVVWDDRLYLTTAIPYGEALPPRHSDAPGAHDNAPVTHRQEFVVLAVSRDDGAILWQTTVRRDLPHDAGHHTGSLASASPVTNGELLFAFFGSYGLHCLNREGELLWQADLGRMQSKHGHGEASSPALHDDTVVVNWDHEGQSFLVAFDTRTGDERWRVERDEPTSWATPIVVEHDGAPQLIVPGTNRMRGYDLRTGDVIWACGGLSANVVASPVAADGMVYAGSSYDTRALIAVHLDGAAGDISSGDRVAWRRVRGTPYVPSPLLYGDALYCLNHYQSIMTRMHAPSGADQPGSFRLDELTDIYASPVGAAGRVYVTDLTGTTVVLTNDEEHQVLAVNRLDDAFTASAAVVGDELFMRGERWLYCIARE